MNRWIWVFGVLTALSLGFLASDSHAQQPAACDLPPTPPKPRDPPPFTLDDLKNTSGIEKLGIVDFWVTRTGEQRAFVREELNKARKEGSDRGVRDKLVHWANEAIYDRRSWERDHGAPERVEVLQGRWDLAKQVEKIDETKAKHDPWALGRSKDPFEMFDLRLRATLDPKNDPRVQLGKFRSEPTPQDRAMTIARRIAGQTGIARRGRDEKPDDDSIGRVLGNLGKGVVGRTPIALAFGEDDLRSKPSPDDLFRQRLTADAFSATKDLEFDSDGKGTVVVRRATDPMVRLALQEVLKPGNFEIVDVAAQRGVGQANPVGDGLLALADFEAVANGNHPQPLKRAAATLADPDTFKALENAAGVGNPDGLAARIDVDAFLVRHTPMPSRYLWSLEPTLVRVWVPSKESAYAPPRTDTRMPRGRELHGDVVEVRRFTPLGEKIAIKETELLTGKISLPEYESFLLDVAAKEAQDGAADARKALAAETDRLLAEVEKSPSSTLYRRAVDKEISKGVNERLHRDYLDRAWYESLGVGTWGAVKEVLMIPIGLGELVIYATDHANVVVWIRGRPDKGKLLWQLTGEERSAALDGIGYAFEDWWDSAQSEPDKAIGQTVGFVATFFIPISKLSKVTRLTEGLTKAVGRADKLIASGRIAEAEVQIARARRSTEALADLGKTRGADKSARAVAEEERLAKLVKAGDDAISKLEADLARAKPFPRSPTEPTPGAAPLRRALYMAEPKCFVAGTQVSIVDSGENGTCGMTQKSIEDVVVGDSVLAWDEEVGAEMPRTVTRTMRKSTGETWSVSIRDVAQGVSQEVTTTAEHPFFVRSQGWVGAAKLMPNDALRGTRGERLVVERVTVNHHVAPVAVFNFAVERSHTYYVAGAAGLPALLVHNDPQCQLADLFEGVSSADDIAHATRVALKDGHKPDAVAAEAARATKAIDAAQAAKKPLRPIDTMAAYPTATEVEQAMSLYEKDPGAARMRDPMSVSEFLGKKNQSANDHSLRVEFLKPNADYKGPPIVFLHSKFHGGDMYWNNRFKDLQLNNMFKGVGLDGTFAEAAHIPNEGAALVRWWNKYTPVASGAPEGLTGAALREEVGRASLMSYIAGDADGLMHNAGNGGFAKFRDASGKESWRGVVIDSGAAWNKPPTKPWNADVMGLGPTLAADIPKDMIPGLQKLAESSADDLARMSKFPAIDEGARDIVRAQRARAQEILDHYKIAYKKPQ